MSHGRSVTNLLDVNLEINQIILTAVSIRLKNFQDCQFLNIKNLGKVYIEERASSPSKQALDSKRWSENSIYLSAGEWSENLGEP